MTLLVHTDRQESAVNGQYVAGDETRAVRGEKNGSTHKFLRWPKTARCTTGKTHEPHSSNHDLFLFVLGAAGPEPSGEDIRGTATKRCPG